ncbi:hypothetical protein ETAA8_25610 [Anatilimnocola aggregata]|uniref:Uncharacterized protein n=1 Tax=Anatilimnocola aggregata TaxID=2528021 RepID=A0A517YB43_9BACT|nr:hypothetical protein ETAA8_25610 [Anatilimnocola aggregata]
MVAAIRFLHTPTMREWLKGPASKACSADSIFDLPGLSNGQPPNFNFVA